MFKQAVVYYPTDANAVKQLNKEIASFHCAAAVKYMDSLNLNLQQKITLTDSLMQDLANVSCNPI